MHSLRIFFIDPIGEQEQAIEEAMKGGPDRIIPMNKTPLPEDGKVIIHKQFLKWHPVTLSGNEITNSDKQDYFTFDVVEQKGNSKTGDIDIFALAKLDNEL